MTSRFALTAVLCANLGTLVALAEDVRSAPVATPPCPPSESDVDTKPSTPVEPRGIWEAWRTKRLKTHSGEARDRAARAPLLDGSVRIVKDIPYGPHCRQRLDLYLPSCAGFPVLVYVHGGSWIAEDKDMYEMVGRYFAAHGVGAVLLEYRLPPDADIEDELHDVAHGVGWTYHNIACFGGDPCRLFLCGHSSGGHMVAMMAMDGRWLNGDGLSPHAIRGVIPISGVYRLGQDLRPFGVGYVFRRTSLKSVSPLKLATPCSPPFLFVYAQHDSVYLKMQARRFCKTLAAAGCMVDTFVISDKDHYGQIFDIACPNDPLGCRLLRFICQE